MFNRIVKRLGFEIMDKKLSRFGELIRVYIKTRQETLWYLTIWLGILYKHINTEYELNL